MSIDCDQEKDHHPFCNKGNVWGPRKDCRSCDNYYKKYPLIKNESGYELIKRLFPTVEIIK